jgi:hypothetical protein
MKMRIEGPGENFTEGGGRGCPNAVFAPHSALLQQLENICKKLGGTYRPSLACDSIGQCITAVQTQSFAAVLPVQCARRLADIEYAVLGEDEFGPLARRVALAWHPRSAEVLGKSFERFRTTFSGNT